MSKSLRGGAEASPRGEDGSLGHGQLAAAISDAVVGELARTTGRGPTRARTTFGSNAIFVVVQDTLTRGERSLLAAGETEAVLELRRRWQRLMAPSCRRKIEELTSRKVIAFMSDDHVDPDMAVEVFILEPLDDHANATADGDGALDGDAARTAERPADADYSGGSRSPS